MEGIGVYRSAISDPSMGRGMQPVVHGCFCSCGDVQGRPAECCGHDSRLCGFALGLRLGLLAGDLAFSFVEEIAFDRI